MLARSISAAPRTSLRQLIAFSIVGVFITYVLLLGISKEAEDYARELEDTLSDPAIISQKKPDLHQYVWGRTLNDKELHFDDANRRILFLGDIHGMKASFDKLLKKLHYNPDNDYLIHVGDILAKGSHKGSLGVLAYMTEHNVTGVRGNHDQMAIGWRAWIENVLSHSGGESWLKELERKSKKDRKEYMKDLNKDLGGREEWKRIPDDWEFEGDHYKIARSMSTEQASYLRSLPLILHIPYLHSFVVHAGLLPLDPRRSPTSFRQPLAHVPESKSEEEERKKDGGYIERLRKRQEEAMLKDIPQNKDPWGLLNMRSILKDHTLSKDAKEGRPWAPLWNSVISRCGGFDVDLGLADEDTDFDDADFFMGDFELQNLKQKLLPCHPATVIYGHAASRGLDVRRWSKGLDTGCVYGRRLTAFVLSPPNSSSSSSSSSDDSDDSDSDDPSIDEGDLSAVSRKKKKRFGDPGETTAHARVVSVSCPDL